MESANEFEWEEKVFKRVFYSIIVIWFLLAFFSAFFDLKISINLIDENSNWANFLADYGEIPGYIVIVIAAFIYNRVRKCDDKGINIIISIIVFIALTVEIYFIGERILGNYISFSTNAKYIIPLIGLFVLFVQKLVEKVERIHFIKYKTFSRITLSLAIINPLIFVQGLKILWGRVRFRDLAPDYSNYTLWFIPQGINGNQSFPSGHAAMGWMLLPLILLTIKKDRRTNILVISSILIWGVIVSLSRIVIGAHYFSDVLFSTGMAMITFLLLYKYHLHQNLDLPIN